MQSSRLNFSRLSALAFTAICMLLVSACAPSPMTFRYISLEENEEIKVIERSKLGIKRLYFDDPIPIRYTLERENYNLHFRIKKNGLMPNMQISAQSKENSKLLLSYELIKGKPSCMHIKLIIIKDGD